jgi:hypothetical protein
MSDDSNLFDRIADSNVERVNRVATVLGVGRANRGVVGGRPDGTMEPAQFQAPSMDTLLQHIESNYANLRAQLDQARSELRQLDETLAREREAREHLQGIIRQVADLIVNGSKGA